jgi:hypothetical protein
VFPYEKISMTSICNDFRDPSPGRAGAFKALLMESFVTVIEKTKIDSPTINSVKMK